MSASKADWARVGAMLENRRAELDPRYRNMKIFERERGIDYRLAWDIEHARRDTYRRVTLTAIEVAYGWQPGSIHRVLEGGDPVPAAATGILETTGIQQPELSAAEAEAFGREMFKVIQGGSTEPDIPQAILDIVRAAAGRKPRRRQGNGTQGALLSASVAADEA